LSIWLFWDLIQFIIDSVQFAIVFINAYAAIGGTIVRQINFQNDTSRGPYATESISNGYDSKSWWNVYMPMYYSLNAINSFLSVLKYFLMNFTMEKFFSFDIETIQGLSSIYMYPWTIKQRNSLSTEILAEFAKIILIGFNFYAWSLSSAEAVENI
jgi:hypothetical protein